MPGESPHLERLSLPLARIDKIIAAIRGSDTVDNARLALISGFGLDELQANAILQMQLSQARGA